ncbi:MAG: hypothetical protein A2V76_08610 [Candidatus Aminicenantes bacterium RBG_16_63_14]|nr:MAG: hypothetical protein A2V76_08610 [Candidatus Aminicenantes bacterium RBG_16_63_14]
MKTRHIGLIGAALLAVFLTALLAAGQKNDQAELALKAAIKTEIVDGNLKGAIELYKKIAALPGAGRATVATALLRMGQCHEKLGDADLREARKAMSKWYGSMPIRPGRPPRPAPGWPRWRGVQGHRAVRR